MSLKGFGIELEYKGILVNFDIYQSTDINSFLVAAKSEEGEKFDLVDDLLGLITSEAENINIDPSLTTIILYGSKITYRKDTDDTEFAINGELGWEPNIDFGGQVISLKISAFADLWKNKDGLQGILYGSVQTPIPGIEFLKLGLGFNVGTNAIFLIIRLGQYEIRGDYDKKPNGDIELEFGLTDMPSLYLGEVITFFAALVDPSIDEYEFEPPWDFLSKIDLAILLTNLKLKLTLKKNKEKVFGITIGGLRELVPNSVKPLVETFLKIKSVELNYTSKPRGKKKKTSITINGSFLGEEKPITWDPVNGGPPDVPGQGGAIFDLRYLGMGQRVAFSDAAKVNNIGEVMGLLRGSLSDAEKKLIENRTLSVGDPGQSFLGGDSPIEFNPEAAWLIGMDVSLLKTLSISLIFNDPFITGIRIELYGEMAKNFAGLKFEILYQRISETIGKYHTELVLPDIVRHMTIGAVSVTLPIIVIDIFTNGDFKVDLGFPWNFNFERSFALEVFPFTGAGGFYFNKLSAATATSTPRLKNGGGEFTPVYEFGIGLRAGLGKSINKGPLKAEFSITMQGIIEGVISYYKPPGGGDQSLYYAIRGGVAIVGRLYGEVDFKVIAIEIEVMVRVSVVLQLAAYTPIDVVVAAEVSVKAKVKVLFVKVSFKFKHKIEQKFVIDSPDGPASAAPWHSNLLNG
ncbi:MAG: hypothetical protein AB8F94_30390 [Saprospiraceae bacterium]